ncbi:hypothetical protein KFU94_24615 [Chloroflexi bacterium TSY]|nr:hypothetical protein [Chloroflexi bacterium TSY]
MKAMLYMLGNKNPVATFDEVNLIEMNDNHQAAPYRFTYKTQSLNAGKTMLELHRDEKMTLKLDDGRVCNVLLQHSSLDMEGNAVGVLRVLGDIS